MEREKTREELHQERQAFIIEAIQEGAHERLRERAVNIGVAYNFGGEPLKVLGDQYEISRAGASLNARKFIEGLWSNSSEGLRSSHILEDLLTKRPESEIISQRRSQVMGGTSLRVKEQVIAGARSIDEIGSNTGFSDDSIRKSFRTLKEWGIDVSHLYRHYEGREKIEQLRKEDDDKKIQQILDELSTSYILSNLVKHKLRKKTERDGIFITVGDLTQGVFHYKNTETGLFFDSLRLSGIPIRRVGRQVGKTGKVLVHYVLLERHRKKALDVLEKDPRLQKYKENPVKLICGQSTDPIPNTHQLTNSKNFRSIGSLFKEMRVPANSKRGPRLHYSKFLTPECPIPVYQYQRSSGGSRYFPIKYSGALKNFLTNRYAALSRT